jgi:hypothetical protein
MCALRFRVDCRGTSSISLSQHLDDQSLVVAMCRGRLHVKVQVRDFRRVDASIVPHLRRLLARFSYTSTPLDPLALTLHIAPHRDHGRAIDTAQDAYAAIVVRLYARYARDRLCPRA